MKKISVYLCTVLITTLTYLSFVSDASAKVRYTYSGNNYTIVDSPYTTSMRLTGWFEINSPIPPNTPYPTQLSAAIISYSFFDGVNTLTNSNSGFVGGAWFATDAQGNITVWEINLSGPVPAAINTPVNMITTNLGSDVVDTNANCVDVNNEICENVSQLNGAFSYNPGTWAMQIISDRAVPTMNEWGMIIMSLILAGSAIWMIRRKTA